MSLPELLYVRLKGFTSSFRIPTVVSGSQLSLLTPSYSNILGILNYALDGPITPNDTLIGFRYSYGFRDFDLETVHRWGRDSDSGTYQYTGTNPRRREIHYNPVLEIFLSNLSLEDAFLLPKNSLFLGRSQDVAYIDLVTKIKVEPANEGLLRGTMLPFEPTKDILYQGIIYNLPEWFDYSTLNHVRRAKNFRSYIALDYNLRPLKHSSLYKPILTENQQQQIDFRENEVCYIYEWLTEPSSMINNGSK